MGSSFAAGPGVGTTVESTPARCSRSTDNYAQQLARMYDLRLTDVSCGGATTAHVLGPWNELPAQVDALRPDTALVTVTIGGNDVNYIGGLMAKSCEQPAAGVAAKVCQKLAEMASADPEARSRAMAASSEDAWQAVKAGLEGIAREVRRRSPNARLVFVDYLSIVPEGELCAQVPLSDEAAASARATAARLAEVTANVARDTGAELIRASELSKNHDACSSAPWMNGFIPSGGAGQFALYHPNLAGMTAIAEALGQRLGR
ncbi:SGNH/GDSL hydrolase family protein [Novosphingobium pentaromativorans]|nr:SGNH/GDSL hydrolase family protein [Novosphingobium pentaromativorans]